MNDALVRLLNQRAEIALSIGELKKKQGADLYAPEREEEIYERICSVNSGPLPDETLRNIFREIMRGTLSLQGEACKRSP